VFHIKLWRDILFQSNVYSLSIFDYLVLCPQQFTPRVSSPGFPWYPKDVGVTTGPRRQPRRRTVGSNRLPSWDAANHLPRQPTFLTRYSLVDLQPVIWVKMDLLPVCTKIMTIDSFVVNQSAIISNFSIVGRHLPLHWTRLLFVRSHTFYF